MGNMADVANKGAENASKKSFFKPIKSEFKKIIWPDKDSLVKQSVSVIIVTVVLGGVIAVLDLGIQYVVNLIL